MNDPQSFELAARERIVVAIEREEELARIAFVGKTVRFTYLSYHIDGPTSIEAPITRVFFDHEDDGHYHMLFEVVARHPYTGRDTAITISPGKFEFI